MYTASQMISQEDMDAGHREMLASAITQNNNAVVQIQHQDYGSAVTMLTGALRSCRELTSIDDDQACDEDLWYSVLSLDECMRLNHSPRLMSLPDDKTDDALCGQYLYENPLAVPNSFQLSSSGLYRASLFLGCIATFNMALALQLAARNGPIEGGDDSRIILRKSSRLYEICLSFQEQREANGELGSSMFTMVTVNNLGLNHRRLNHRNTAERCFQFVLSTLMFLTAECTGDHMFLELDGFFRNAYTVMRKSQSAPAA